LKKIITNKKTMLKNIYLMCMRLSLLFAVFPLLAFVSANIWAYLYECEAVINTQVVCHKADLIASLFALSWYWIITLPLGIVIFLVFYFLYLTVRRK